MKLVKYSFMALGVAFIANIALVRALTYPNANGYIYGTATMPAGKTVRLNGEVQKSDISAQSVTNTRTFTTITDPCTDCKIDVKLLRKLSSNSFDTVGSITFKQGETKAFTQNVSYTEGIYNLSFKRNGITDVTTYVGFDWRVQNSKM